MCHPNVEKKANLPSDTKAKLLSTQPKIEFEYSFMLYLLYKITVDEVVSIE